MAFNKKNIAKQNGKAIATLYFNNLSKSEKDIELLKLYRGYGGITEILTPITELKEKHNNDTITEVERNLYDTYVFIDTFTKLDADKVFNDLKSSVLTSFYTPPSIIDSSLSFLKNDKSIQSILDPSTGHGNYIESLVDLFPKAKITGVEKENIAATIAGNIYANNPNVSIQHKSFETFNESYNNKYDLIVSNIPFGSINVFDPDFKNSKNKAFSDSTKSIHNYFFLKAKKSLSENGYLMFITSTGFADNKQNNHIRKELLSDADLISVIRLPNTVFKNYAGTEANSDIIFIKKNSSKNDLSLNEKEFIETGSISIKNDKGNYQDVTANQYIINNKTKIIGDIGLGGLYNNDSFFVTSELTLSQISEDIQSIISSDFKNYLLLKNINEVSTKEISDSSTSSEEKLLDDAFGISKKLENKPKKTIIDIDKPIIEKKLIVPPKSKIKPGKQLSLFDIPITPLNISVTKEENIISKPKKSVEAEKPNQKTKTLSSLLINSSNDDKTQLLLDIQNNYLELIEFRSDSNYSSYNLSLEKLNSKYNAYIKDYDVINKFTDYQKYSDLGLREPILKSLELYDQSSKKFVKSDLFNNNIDSNKDVSLNKNEAVMLSINSKGKIDIPFIANQLKLNTDQNSINKFTKELVSEEIILPVYSDKNNYHFETKNNFLSGDIYAKKKMVSEFYPESSPVKESILKHLETVIPKKIPVNLINIKFGERWIPAEIYKDFIENSLVPNSQVNLHYNKFSDRYLIQFTKKSPSMDNLVISKKFGNNVNAAQVLDYAFDDMKTTLSYTDKDGKRITDKIATQMLENKIDEINMNFQMFILSDTKISNKVETLYNHKFNSNVKNKFDGSFLDLPYLNKNIFTPRKHQLDATWQILYNNGGIADHTVGAGKTFVLGAAAIEMKRMNIAKKPIILGHNSNYLKLAEEIQTMFPSAKLAVLHPSQNTPTKRALFFQNVANNDYDITIINHAQFGKIPLPKEYQQKVLSEEINELNKNLEALINSGNVDDSVRIRKGLEKRKANLESKLLYLVDSKNKYADNVLDFKAIGFDHILIDESHEFKNLQYSTRSNRVAGLPNQAGAEKNFNLLVCSRYLQDKYQADKGITFASGTTISNSIAEMYLIFKYLRPKELEKRNLNSFDSWAISFAEKSTNWEISVTNDLIKKERFRAFNKVPELSFMYDEIAHSVLSKDLKVDRPDLKNHLIEIDPSNAQSKYGETLRQFAKTANFDLLESNTVYGEKAEKGVMLIATDQASKLALDMRLVNDKYEDNPNSKVNNLVRKAIQIYNESNHFKGTQSIFLDKGLPNKNDKDKFSVVNDLRDKLILQGIPKDEIAFINDYSKSKVSKLMDNLNKGNVRFIIGSSATLGTGRNFQKRLAAMHHITIPWRPMDLEQRNGRGHRQGNIYAKKFNNNQVPAYYYATKNTLDLFKFNLISVKQKFIDQCKTASGNQRKVYDDSIDANFVDFNTFAAALSGDNTLLEKAKLEQKIEKLLIQKQSSIYAVTLKNNEISDLKDQIGKLKYHIPKYKLYAEAFQKLFPLDKKTSKRLNEVNIDGRNFYNDTEISNNLKNHYHSLKRNGKINDVGVTLAKKGMFELKVKSSDDNYSNLGTHIYMQVMNETIIQLNHSTGHFYANDKDNARMIIDNASRFNRLHNNTVDRLDKLEKKLQVVENKVVPKYDNKEIEKSKKELDKINIKLDSMFSDDKNFNQMENNSTDNKQNNKNSEKNDSKRNKGRGL